MHIASKVTLILGAILLAVGGIGLVAGIGSVADSGELKETYLTGVTDGTFTPNVNESWTISVYVFHPVDCETLELYITDSNGNDVIGECWIYSDESTPENTEVLYGDIAHTPGMQYTVESNAEVTVRGTYCDEACVEAVVGGIFGALGGFGAVCCAIPLLVLGLILAFVLDDPVQNVMMPAGQMPTGQVGYQAPVMGQPPASQNMNQVPVMGQAPVGQPMQNMGEPQAQITPPLTQQPVQPNQPAQSPWDDVQPPQ